MPRNAIFIIQKGIVDPAASELSTCKAKISALAEQLETIEKNLKTKNDKINFYADVYSGLRSRMNKNAKTIGQLADAAGWAVERYHKAENELLGIAPVYEESSGSYGSGGGPSFEPGRIPGVENGGTLPIFVPGGYIPGEGDFDSEGGGGRPKKPGTQWGYSTSKDEWDAWTNEEKHTHYTKAKIKYKWDEEKGEYVPVGVTDYYNKTETTWTVGFFDPTEKTAASDTKLGGFEEGLNKSINEKWGYNKWKTDDESTWHKRVYETNDATKKVERVTGKDEMEENEFSQDLVGVQIFHAEKQVGWTLFGGDHRAKGEYGEAGMSYGFLNAEAHVGGGVGVYYVEKDGKKVLAMGADVTMGASFTVFKLNGDVQTYWKPGTDWLGEDFVAIGAKAAAGVNVGKVQAEGGVKCRLIDGQPEIAAEVGAGAYAVQASASGSVTVAGIEATAKGTVQVGIGAKATVGLTGGKFRCELGACLGVGFNVNFELDVSGLVSGVKNVVSKTVSAVSGGVKKAAKKVGKAAKKVAKKLTSW